MSTRAVIAESEKDKKTEAKAHVFKNDFFGSTATSVPFMV